jgi:hypothetical protein
LEPGNLWDRNRGIRFGDEETKLQYNRFKSYLALPPPRRYTTIAAIEKVTVGYIANLAKSRNWRERADAFDRYRETQGLPEPLKNPLVVERLQVMDEEPPPRPLPFLSSPARSMRAQEEYRLAILSLGKRQLQACEHLTEGFVRLSSHTLQIIERTVSMAAAHQEAEETRDTRASEQFLSQQLTIAAQTLQRLSAAATQMGTLGRENWGQAVGVAAMLERFEALLAQGEGMGYAEMQPAAIACATDPQQPPEEDQSE